MITLHKSSATVAQESDAIMRQFDELGPLARQAFNECARSPDVLVFLEQFKRLRHQLWFARQDLLALPRLDWLDPVTDAALADYVRRIVENTMSASKDKIPWRPLVPRQEHRPDRITRRLQALATRQPPGPRLPSSSAPSTT